MALLDKDGFIHFWSKLKAKLATKADSVHTHTKSQITDFPTSMPASDVYSWAKASSKPSYAISEISELQSALDGKSSTSHNHDERYSKILVRKTATMHYEYDNDDGEYWGYPILPALNIGEVAIGVATATQGGWWGSASISGGGTYVVGLSEIKSAGISYTGGGHSMNKGDTISFRYERIS